jgi:hypothetical protein
MPDHVNLNMLYEKVGEVGAIAREAKHAANNASAKIDSLAIVVATQGETRRAAKLDGLCAGNGLSRNRIDHAAGQGVWRADLFHPDV